MAPGALLRHDRAGANDLGLLLPLGRAACRNWLPVLPGHTDRGDADDPVVHHLFLRLGGRQRWLPDRQRGLPDGSKGDGHSALLLPSHGSGRDLWSRHIRPANRYGQRLEPVHRLSRRRGVDDPRGHRGAVARREGRGQVARRRGAAAYGDRGSDRSLSRQSLNTPTLSPWPPHPGRRRYGLVLVPRRSCQDITFHVPPLVRGPRGPVGDRSVQLDRVLTLGPIDLGSRLGWLLGSAAWRRQ